MKKKPSSSSSSHGTSIPWNNPFAGLKLDLPKEPAAPVPPPSPAPAEPPREPLTAEDQNLLAAFGGASLA
ncbi:MAG: hypothetical protein J6Y80_01075, partial [Victivallales bacterium]|nr:hypothetical protein [Victivallales bacterium]